MRFPMFGGLWPIRPRDALRDASAGLTLASMNIPQVLGYTRIAGTPVVADLYTVLLPLVAFALFGSSRHLIVAADSATAAIFASSLSRMAEPASAHYMALVGMVALLTAEWLNLPQHGFSVIGPVQRGLPSLGLPSVSLSEKLAVLPVALSCFVMIIAQSAATSRVYAIRHQERVDENADILGLAAANAAAAVSGAFVVDGSPTQTAMADGAGARSQIAQLAFSAIVLIVLLFLTGPLQYLPHCVLASIVFTIAVGMVDIAGLRGILQESRGEFMLATATAVAVVAVGVEQGILFAIGFSLVRHVRHSYEAHSMVLVPDASGRWEPAPAQPGLQTEPGLIVYRYGADLFYANADHFADEVRELVEKAPAPIQWLVFDAEAIGDVDLSAAQTIRSLLEDLNRKGVRAVFGRVNRYLLSDMRRHRLAAVIGDGRIFPTLHEALDAIRAEGFPTGPDSTKGPVAR
jgi:sulfate permease, SulP family